MLHDAYEHQDPNKIPAEDEDGREAVRKCLAFTKSVLTGDGWTVKREVTLPIMDDDRGRLDLLALRGTQAVYLDPKFAVNLQEEAETNPAAQAYAYAILNAFPYIRQVDTYYLYPFLDHISYTTFTRAHLPRIEARLKLIKDRAAKAKPETCAFHDDTCRYCRFLSVCPTAAKLLLPVARRYAEGHELKDLPAVPDFSLVRDPDQWGRLMRGAAVLEDTASSIKRHALEFRRETGIEIPGFDLATRKGAKKVTQPLLARFVANEHGITDEQFMTSVSVSTKELLDLAKANAERGDKEKAAQRLENALRDAGALEVGNDIQYLKKAKE